MKDWGSAGINYTGVWPNVLPKNSSTGTSTDGTVYNADVIQPLWSLTQALMNRLPMAVSGTLEVYTAVGSGSSSGLGAIPGDPAQQLMWALQRNFSAPGEIVPHFLNSTAQGQVRALPLNGQVIDGFTYPDLWYNTWVGSAANAAAPAFYTTSDSGGTTRATTGLTVNGVTGGRYLNLPDCRGLFARGIGTSTVNQGANGTYFTGGSSMGQVLLDMTQGHVHVLTFYASVSGGGNTYPGTTNSFTSGPYFNVTNLPSTDGTNSTPRTGFETRPVSFACMWAVRY
jgi:hypothetical protein